MKTKSLISWLAMLTLVFGAQRGVTAAGDPQKKKPPAQDTYTITQLDLGALDKKSSFHAVLWAPSSASTKR